ncbi:hypothetical protein EVAR_35399_1 [Eumeta japonica]|uniref:Uncharacterized protein n=1 Tax=Eumeta variegata TaxID=151549 RepID=A0A4C1XAJ6_EUMVA|nr:hypothetical protein EVAR_35399_1 [Eumeta japonica]
MFSPAPIARGVINPRTRRPRPESSCLRVRRARPVSAHRGRNKWNSSVRYFTFRFTVKLKKLCCNACPIGAEGGARPSLHARVLFSNVFRVDTACTKTDTKRSKSINILPEIILWNISQHGRRRRRRRRSRRNPIAARGPGYSLKVRVRRRQNAAEVPGLTALARWLCAPLAAGPGLLRRQI